MIVAVLLGIVSLVVFVAAFFASKAWHWAHVTTLVLLYFGAVGYFLLASQTLTLRGKFQKQLYTAQQDLDRQTVDIRALKVGTTDDTVIARLAAQETVIAEGAETIGGIQQLQHDLRIANRERGRVWRGGVRTAIDQQTGRVTVEFPIAVVQKSTDEEGEEPTEEEAPAAAPAGDTPLGLAPGSVVYAFEQGGTKAADKKLAAEFLGEFRVVEVKGRVATLDPLSQFNLDPVSGQRLLASPGPWIVYESMPADRADLFAGLSEKQLRKLLPPSVVVEYLRDGKPASADDDEFRKQPLTDEGEPLAPDDAGKAKKFNFRRMPRDYAFLFQDYDKEQAELTTQVQATQVDIQKLKTALVGAKALGAMREDESAKLRKDLASLKKDRDAVERHLKRLQSQIANAERLLEQTLRENAALVARAEQERGVLTPAASGALDADAL
ncbi:MAG: hypothetical protein ACRCT8_01600 [Lacipirellulaceae bacterium]